MAGSIFIPLISVFDGKGISQAKTGLASIAGAIKGLKGAAVAAAASMATVGSISFVKDAVTNARDLERNMVGLGNVFGDVTPSMTQFTKDAQAIGMSQIEASRASTFLGSVLKQSGFTMGDTAEQTKNLVGLASDLAVTYGYDVSEALTGMTALFRGEYDPIEKFGVAMKQAEVNALLAARGQKGLTGEALRHAQAQARLDLLYNRSQDAQGAYAEQSDSLYVAQKNLMATFENMKTSLGESLLKPLAALLQAMQPVVEVMGKSLAPIFDVLAKVVTALAPIFTPLIEVFMSLFDALAPILDLLISLIKPLMIPLVGVVQLLANAFKLLTPLIGLVAGALKVVLVPVLSFFSWAIGMAVKGVAALIGSLAQIPMVGEMFKSANNALNDFLKPFDDLNDKFLGTTKANDDLTKSLSKKRKVPELEPITTAVNKVGEAAKKASDRINKLLEDALNIQKSIIDSANITGVLDNTSQEITQSLVYLDGQFKTVVSGVTKGSGNLVAAFQDNLTKIKTFYTNINKLTAAGLSPELIGQITAAGPEAGNATAEAILASGKTGVKSLNTTFKEIKAVAGNIGAKVAGVMENTGSDIGNGLIDGLKAQANKLNYTAQQLAMNAANAFSSTLDTTLNPKKPYTGGGAWSTAYKVTPVFNASAFAGITQGTDRYSNMSAYSIKNPFSQKDNPKGYYRFQSDLNKAQQYNINIQVAPTASGSEVGQALVAAIKQYERSKGKGWRE